MIFLLIVMVLLAASFAIGGILQAPNSDALQRAQERVLVTAEVEERVITESLTVSAQVEPGKQLSIYWGSQSLTQPDATGNGGEKSSSPNTEGKAANASQASQQTSRGLVAAGVVYRQETEEKPKGDDKPAEAKPIVPATDKTVVTKVVRSLGETVAYGQQLAEVSNRPLIAMPSSIPFYRDLVLGSTGSDVLALQQALIEMGYYGVNDSGTVDAGLLNAVRRMYVELGYAAPVLGEGAQAALAVSWKEFALVPTGGGSIVSVAEVGAETDTQTPVVALQLTEPHFVGKITLRQAKNVKVGDNMEVVVSGAASVPGTITEIRPLTTDPETGASNHDIVVSGSAELMQSLTDSDLIQLSATVPQLPGPAVPLSALAQNGEGFYVALAPHDLQAYRTQQLAGENPTLELVQITVAAQGEGWATIAENPQLPVGTRLLIPENE